LIGAGLPDGIFSYQKSEFGYILNGPGMDFAGIFYGQWVYFAPIGYVSWPFGIFLGRLVHIFTVLVCFT
jgi:hypothetical protein